MSLNVSCSRPLAALALFAALSSAPFESLAHAQGGGPNAEAMADARFKAGLKAYDKADYEGARLEFLQAQSIFPRPSLLRNLALSELHTNRPLDALQHLRTYIADAGTAPDKRALAERNLGEAYAQTGHLSITAPEGTHVKVDGKEVGVTPLRAAVDVPVGLHGVDADVGGAGMHESVQAGAGKLTEVAFVGAVVGVTRVVGLPPVTPVGVTPPPSAGDVAVPMKPVPYWNERRTVGVVIAGVGVAGLIVGGVFGGQRGSETTDANNALAKIGPSGSACTNPQGSSLTASCSSLSSARSSNRTDAQAEESLLIGGGVLLAVGLVTAFWPSMGDSHTTALAPMAGPHTAGLQWGGSF
jgi:hypothetical protein